MILVVREVGQSLRISHPEKGEMLVTVRRIVRDQVGIEIEAPNTVPIVLGETRWGQLRDE